MLRSVRFLSCLVVCLSPGLYNSGVMAFESTDSAQEASASLTTFVVPAQMVKLTLAPLDSSDRLELNHFQPLSHWDQSFLFFDQTFYAKSRPFGEAGAGLPVVETLGGSARLGYRHLVNEGRGFLGLNGGYDSSWQQGYYFQQLGLGIEATFPGIAITATVTHGVGSTYDLGLGQALLSSFNIQTSFPIGIPHLSIAPRYYYVRDRFGQSSPGGQLQFSYGLNRALSLSLSASYDDLSGSGGSLQFKYFFHPPNPSQVPAVIPYGIASPFSQAIGNTGSRIIRLTNSPPAYGD
jgi:hypothetical protein